MTEHEGHPAGWEGYRAVGLIANPFLVAGARASETVGIRATARSAALKMISGIEGALQSERPKPVRVLKSTELPSYYPRSAMTVALKALGSESDTGLLTLYVPLIMMRKGRIRGTLSVLAEMVSSRDVDLTLAHYSRAALEGADATLPEWEPVSALDVPVLVAEFADTPREATERVFGAPVELRDEESDRAMEEVMRDAGMRQAHQVGDPEEDEETPEESALDALVAEVESEKAVVALPEGAEDAGEADGEEEESEPEPEPESVLVSRYVIAHMRKHASPVLARGVRKYVESGTAAMGQELKITKAPRKTLSVLAAFAGLTYRSVVVLYDGFETWVDIPDDLRITIVTGLSEVRYALGGNGVILIAGSDKEEPEIDDQFANAVRVEWDMSELTRVEAADTPLDIDAMREWLADATLPGADTSELWKDIEEALSNATDLASGVEIASRIVEEAAGSSHGTD